MSIKESIGSSEQVKDDAESQTEGTSWQNPGDFPPFNGRKSASETAAETKKIEREKARSEAEKKYQEELSRPYEEAADKEGITSFPIEFNGQKINGYEFAGSEFKMLVSVVGAVGQSLGEHSREIDLDRWMNSSREYISTSLISNNKIVLFDKKGLVFGFNKLEEGDFLSAAPADHGVLRDIGKMGQYKDRVMGPDELLGATNTRESLTPWNEVELKGSTRPDSIIVFGESQSDISDEAKEAALFFGVPIYLIRTDVYGEPIDRHNDRDTTDDVKEFWKNRENPISGRAEQERNALLGEVATYFETGVIGERIAKYLSGYENELRAAKGGSSNADEFVKNLVAMLGQEKTAALKEQINDGD